MNDEIENAINQLLLNYFPEEETVKQFKDAHQMVMQVFDDALSESRKNIYRPKLEDVK